MKTIIKYLILATITCGLYAQSIPTISDVENFKLDIDAAAAIVNGDESTTVTTRLGTQVPTLAKASALFGSVIRPVDSKSDLKAIAYSSLVDGVSYLTLGFTTPGDFGGNQYYWDSNSTATETLGNYFKAAGQTTEPGRWVALFGTFIRPEQFGGTIDAADAAPGWQAALDFVTNGADSYAPSKASGGAGRVSIKARSGTYTLASPLDCSQRDYVRIEGTGRTILNTTHTSYAIDCSSMDHCEFVGFRITGTASIGLYINRCTTNPFAMFNKFRHLSIVLSNDTTANGGLGTIGVFNNRGEQNLYENMEIRANFPYWADNTDNSSFPPLFGTADTAIVSATVNIHEQCNFIRYEKNTAAMRLDGVITFEFNNCYWASTTPATPDSWATLTAYVIGDTVSESGVYYTCQVDHTSVTFSTDLAAGKWRVFDEYAVRMTSCNNCKFSGSVEAIARFIELREDNFGNDVNIIMQVAELDNQGVINMNQSGSVGFLDGYVDVTIAGGTPASGATIFKDNGTATTLKILGNIIKTTSLMATISDNGARGANVSRNLEIRDSVLKLTDPVLQFANPVASGDPNTLDDYEEGTFTPTVRGLTTAGTGTYSIQNGSYTKVGDLVTFSLNLNWSAHTGTGDMRIDGLPFTSSATSNSQNVVSIRPNSISLTAGYIIGGYVPVASSVITLDQIQVGGGAIITVPIDTAGSIWVSGSYRV